MEPTRRISIEVLTDSEAPHAPIDEVARGLEEISNKLPMIEIVARGGLVRVSQSSSVAIDTGDMPLINIESDFGIIVTSRPIVVPSSELNIVVPNAIVVGNTWHTNEKSFSMVDVARARSPRITAKHEVGHLFHIPNGGKKFDNYFHCTSNHCIMHAIAGGERNEFCKRCFKQLSRSVQNLLEFSD